MSAQFAIAALPKRPELAPVEAVAAAPRRIKASLPIVASLAMVGFVAVQLVLGVALAGGAYEIDRLQTAQVELSRNQTAAAEELVRVQSAQYLAENAEALGMVPNANPVYLRLSDAAVLGQPSATPAGGAFPGAAIPNALLADVPLATELEAARSASLTRSPGVVAGALAADAAMPATPAAAAGTAPVASVPLPSSGIPQLQTR